MSARDRSVLGVLGFLLLLPLAETGAVWAASSTMSFERLGPEHGLGHNTVNDILEDRWGFLWLATDGGLSRYDGYGFETFRIDPGAGSNVLMVLLEDYEGRLWVGSESGLFTFDRNTGSYSRALLESGGAVANGHTKALFEDSEGRIWAGIGGSIWRSQSGSDLFEEVPVPGRFESVGSLAEAPDGGLWAILGDAGGLETEVVEIAPRRELPRRARLGGRFHLALHIDWHGRFWTGPLAPEVEPEVDLQGISIDTIGGLDTNFNDLLELDDGTFWVASASGLYRFDPDSGESRRILFRTGAPSWQQEQILVVEIDRAGGLWLGTLGGLYHHDPHEKSFSNWRHDPREPQSLSADAISDIIGGPDGALWIGTFGGGLNRVDPATRRAEHFRHDPDDETSLPADVVWTLARGSEGGLWSAPRVPARLDPESGKVERYPWPFQDRNGEPSVHATTSRVGADGVVWLGTLRRGLFGYDLARRSWRHWPDLDVYSLSEIDGSLVWVGRVGAISRLDLASGHAEHIELRTTDGRPIGDVEVLDLVVLGEDLWLGTTAGLGRLDLESKALELPVQANLLPGTVVFTIQPDDEGRLWLGTNQGLARFDPFSDVGPGADAEPPAQVRVYDLADGVGNVEFNRHSRHLAEDGTIYLGGMTGVTFFRPADIRDNPYVPPVVLTAVHSLGPSGERTIPVHGLPAETISAAADGERLVLPPLTSAVTFSYTALNFTRADKNRYAYRLEGIDDDWIDGGSERTARYTRLPPGRYVFHVRASNNDGVWNRVGARLPIVIEPALWQTWWFRLFALVILAAAVYGAYRFRLRRLLEIERMRLRIAGDLHDELGSELSGIALVSSLLAGRQDLEASDRRRLEDIETSSLGMAERLRDIVWYVNPQHDNWPSIESRMRSIASKLLAGIDYRFEVELGEARQKVDMASRRNLHLIFRELLHNVARHSRAKSVEIRLDVTGGKVLLEVLDDGIGFDVEQATDGSGLGSIRRRARELGAELRIDSRPGRGTSVRVENRMT